jgi:hypothetical protein
MSHAKGRKVKLIVVEPDEVCQKKRFEAAFKKCVAGYHLINTSCIKESKWEEINTTVFLSAGVDVYSKSNGSHLSGMDIDCSIGRISNKSTAYSADKKSFDISSYRLTTVCSDKHCGTCVDIVDEINKRKNFDYYSIIVRSECSKTDQIEYDWLLIPSNHAAFAPDSYEWVPMIGKQGKNKNSQIGWTTNIINGCKMTITFSMSSQLWIHIEMTDEIKEFIVATATVKNSPMYNYIDIYDKLSLSLAT